MMLAERIADPRYEHERCTRCGRVPLPHTHLIPKVAGGLTVLDRDDYLYDRDYLEEAVWVAYELALTAWHDDPTVLPTLTDEATYLHGFLTALAPRQPWPTDWTLTGLGMRVDFSINDDGHLASEAGATEITCTLTEKLT